MLHGLQYPDAADAIKLKQRFKQPVPPELIAPELHDVEYALWRSFWDLSTERQAGVDRQGRIRWSAIQQYGKMMGIEPRLFERVIRAMDEAYLIHLAGEAVNKPAFNKDMLKR